MITSRADAAVYPSLINKRVGERDEKKL